MFAHHIVVTSKPLIPPVMPPTTPPTTSPTGGGTTFGGAAFRTDGDTLTVGGEWRSEQSRDDSYSKSLLHLHHISFLSKASQTTSPPVSSIAGQAGNLLPRGLNRSPNGVTMLAKFAER
jgi:hypothetical protein